MSNHEFTRTGIVGDCYVTCTCGHTSDRLRFTWELNDWERDHLSEVSRVRSRLTRTVAREKPVPDEDQLPLF